MRTAEIRQSVENFGIARTACDLVLRAINRLLFFKILRGIVIESVNPRFLVCDDRYRFGRLEEPTLRKFAASQDYELSDEFLREAFTRGDECYGFLDGEELAAYGWYTRRPTSLDRPQLVLHFSDRYIYMYKGFTHPAYRGQRLHAIGMTKALAVFLARGYRGLVSYVEATNFSSLRSCYRMGYSDFGTVAILGRGARGLVRVSAGCRPYEFRVEWSLPAVA
jgi:ribosomal protein S18 acetylase RimI-like enzyme